MSGCKWHFISITDNGFDDDNLTAKPKSATLASSMCAIGNFPSLTFPKQPEPRAGPTNVGPDLGPNYF